MSYQYIFTMKGLSKTVPPQKTILKNIWLSFFPGAKIGVIGLNGSGKSTLLRIMAGLDEQFEGEAWPAEGVTIGYLPQEPELDPEKTVDQIVQQGAASTFALLERFEAINASFEHEMSPEQMDKALAEQAALQDQIDSLNAWDIHSQLEMAMDALRCPAGTTSISTLSGGERRRVALCRLLLQKPDLLLLDEPTNHLDAETVAWLENYLKEYEGTIVAITHDRYFLDNVAGWILELDRGEGIPWEGNYSSWLEQKQKRLAQEEKTQSKQQKALERELEWVRMSPKARQTKSKARYKNYEDLLNAEKREDSLAGTIYIPPGPRLGDVVIEAKGLTKAYGDKLLFDQLDFLITPGSIVGLIGPNGAGKTTLFNMIAGMEPPDQGEIRLGTTVTLAYADQMRKDLKPEDTVWQGVSLGQDLIQLGNRSVNSRAYLSWFNIKGNDQQKKIGILSGGERNRVNLAQTFKSEGNVLLLDEPTNDLDVETLRNLELALEHFPGCVLVISHDRWFLNRIATHILAFEGDSHVEWFEGSYADYEKDRKKRLGEDAMVPHRIKYRKFSRH
jgi:ATP-binding cassette ChvD family protein